MTRLKQAQPAIRAFRAASLYLFASHARHEPRPDSDDDVFIDKEPSRLPMHQNRILQRPFHFITVVWGKAFSNSFLEYCVASLLSPGNLPALRTAQRSKFLIATLPSDWEYMNATPIFSRLRQYVEPIFIEIPPCPKGKSGCEHMGVGHKAACDLAHREQAYGVVLTPDCMISDGTVQHLQDHAARGIELVWVPALRFAEEPFLGHLRAYGLLPDEDRRQTCNPLIITGPEMVRAAINGLHTETMSYEWDASYFPTLPSAVWWRVPGENGMLIHSLSWAPLLLDFAAVESHDTTALENWTIDGDYAFKNLGSTPKVHLVEDSDEMFCSSWSPLADRARDLKPRYISKYNLVNFLSKANEFRSAFYSPIFDPLKRRMFVYPLRWHGNPINSRWRPVERKSKWTLRFCLGNGLVLMKPLMTCFRLITGHLDSWEAYQDRGIKRDGVGDYLGAAADFAQAIRIGPPNPALHYLRGVTLLRAAHSREATAEFEAGLKLDPTNSTLRRLLDIYRTNYWLDEHRWQPSKLKLKRVSRIYFNLRRFKLVNKCGKLFMGLLDSWQAYQDRGIKRDAIGDHLGAVEDFAYALRLAPPNPALHYLRGITLLRVADSREAAVEFEAGLKLDPTNITLQSLLHQAQHASST